MYSSLGSDVCTLCSLLAVAQCLNIKHCRRFEGTWLPLSRSEWRKRLLPLKRRQFLPSGGAIPKRLCSEYWPP